MKPININHPSFTVVGTNIDEVKKQNAQSGLSYNEVKELLAKQGGYNSNTHSPTVGTEGDTNLNQ